MKFNHYDNTLRCYDLVLERDLEYYPQISLPYGYHFSFYQTDDRDAWISIEQSVTAFDTYEQGAAAWKMYYDGKEEMLLNRMVFIEDTAGQKIATATIYSDEKDASGSGWLHYVAIHRDHQGKGLSKPLLTFTLNIMKGMGYSHVKVKAQTTSWLACKIYLEFGFEPTVESAVQNRDGWRIIRTLTDHPTLQEFEPMNNNKMI